MTSSYVDSHPGKNCDNEWIPVLAILSFWMIGLTFVQQQRVQLAAWGSGAWKPDILQGPAKSRPKLWDTLSTDIAVWEACWLPWGAFSKSVFSDLENLFKMEVLIQSMVWSCLRVCMSSQLPVVSDAADPGPYFEKKKVPGSRGYFYHFLCYKQPLQLWIHVIRHILI